MSGKTVPALVLACSLLAAAACGPAPTASVAGDAATPEQAEEVSPVQPDPTPEQVSAGDAAAPGTENASGDAGTDVQSLDWGDGDENCIVPGLVITGQGQDAAPCAPVPAAEDEAGAEEQEETGAVPQDTTPQEQEQPQSQDATAEAVALAVTDLAQRLGIAADDIDVRDVHAITWPNTSLGCPQPDMMYAEVLQDGLVITLSARGEIYFYHSGGDQPPFLCEQTLEGLRTDPKTPDELVPPPDFDVEKKD